MSTSRRNIRQRRAAWVAFGVVALALFSGVAAGSTATSSISTTTDVMAQTQVAAAEAVETSLTAEKPLTDDPNPKAVEAGRAFVQATTLLSTLPTVPPLRSQWSLEPTRPKSFMSSLFPNHQGPIATAIRILGTLRQQSWLPRFLAKKINGKRWGSKQTDSQKARATKAIELLEFAAEAGNTDALYKLAQISLFPPLVLPVNATKAFEKYQEHAKLTGNATSQAMLGFFYSTGYGDVPVDQAQALLYYTFAAIGGDQGAEMALGYRYWMGIGVSEDCMLALDWYESAAERSMAHFLSGPPGGRTLPHTATKLSDLAGGVYGYGASMASTGPNANRPVIKASLAQHMGETWEDVLEYWQFHADRGDVESCYRLGKIYYHGGIYTPPGGVSAGAEGASALPKDFDAAWTYFLKVARKVWTRDNPSKHQQYRKQNVESTDLYYAVHAAFYLGRMHLRGEGVRQDVKTARMWFERGAGEGDKESLNALGIIHRDGLLDGNAREDAALVQFGRAAAAELPEALVNMGKIYYQHGNTRLAKQYFEYALRHGSQFEAYYWSAQVHANMARQQVAQEAIPNTGSCAVATSFYKIVAERGSWKSTLIPEAERLWKSGGEQDKEAAILRWMIAADRGVEAAQNNVAYILDQDRPSLRWGLRSPEPPSNKSAQLALLHWTRSAGQGDVDAMVKLGDYYYHGLGVNEPNVLLKEKAAGYYQSAIETHSALAMWNIGWMYENGVGVSQDFHLAKRHYDMALEHNVAAYFPIVLSLIKLHLRSLWYIAAGGRQPNLILWGDDGDDDHWWPSKLWRTEAEPEENVDTAEGPGRQHRANAPAGIMDEDQDDPVARVREIREQQARTEEDNDPGEDFYDGMTIRRGAGEGEGMPQDEFWESAILAFLLVGITGLMWLRGRYVLRREEEERRRRQEIHAAEQRERQREQRQRAAQNQGQDQTGDDEGEEAPVNAGLQHQQPGGGGGEPPGREALQPQMAMFM